MKNYKEKRINFINNWPNGDPFLIEKRYLELLNAYKKSNQTALFKPLIMKVNDDEYYNKAISFLIDSLEMMPQYPNFAFEFLFKAFDTFSKSRYEDDNITIRIKKVIDNILINQISISSHLEIAINNLLKSMPSKTLQFLYIRLFQTIPNQVYKRIITDQDNKINHHRKTILDQIYAKYGCSYNNYSEGIRQGSRLLDKIFKQDSIILNDNTINILKEDKLHLLISGILYTMRNDMMHGNSMSPSKSSKASLDVYKHSYFCFLATYYLLMLIITDALYDNDAAVLIKLSTSLNENLNNYIKLFNIK